MSAKNHRSVYSWSRWQDPRSGYGYSWSRWRDLRSRYGARARRRCESQLCSSQWRQYQIDLVGIDLTSEGRANEWRRLDQWRSSKQVKETWPVKVEQTSKGDLTQKSAANVVCKVKHANQRTGCGKDICPAGCLGRLGWCIIIIRDEVYSFWSLWGGCVHVWEWNQVW